MAKSEKADGLSDVSADGVVILRKVSGPKGRPRLQLTPEGAGMVERLASIGCTKIEIAAAMGVDIRTLEASHNKALFADAHVKGAEAQKVAIRRAQMAILERGSTAMAIYLGKNYLGQSDRTELSVTERLPSDMDIDELYAAVSKKKRR